MLKSGTLLLALVLLPIGVDAVDFGVVSTADYLRFPVVAVDSAGIEQAPDSGHVLVWFEGEGSANAASFTDRWTTTGANGSYIDSVRYASHSYYYFVDQVADLDNDEGNGVYTGVVVLFTDGEPYPNRFAFTLAGDELADYWAEVTRVGDSIDAFNGWIGQQSEIANLDGWNPASDGVLADLTSISGDATAADNLETMVDGTGGQKLTLGGLHIRAAGNDTALVAQGSGSGLGAHLLGGVTIEAVSTGNALTLVSPDTGLFVNGSVAGIVSDVVGTVTPTDTNSSGETMAVMPDHWSAADSAAFQGSASGLDSATVARAVWNAPHLSHTEGGTFGAYLDAPVSGVSGGSGAYSVTLVAFDTVNTQTVPGVRLAVRNADQSSLLALAGTGPSGTATVNLDVGEYLISASAPGYSFDAFHTLSLTGPVTDSVFGYQFDPGSPESPSLCRVYGYLYLTTGEPERDATIAVHLPAGVSRFGGLIISPYPTEVTTDDNGYFYIDMVPSTLLTGSPLYEFTISRSDGTILRKRLSVPDIDNWQLTW